MEQAISDLPREDGRALALVEGNLAHDLGGGDAGLAAADGSGPDRPGFVVPAIIIICGTIRYTRQASKAVYAAVFVSTKFVRKEKGVWVRGRNEQYFNQPSKDLGDAAIANLQYPGDVAGPRAGMSQLDDLLPGRVWKRSTADEHTPELIHATVTCSVVQSDTRLYVKWIRSLLENRKKLKNFFNCFLDFFPDRLETFVKDIEMY